MDLQALLELIISSPPVEQWLYFGIAASLIVQFAFYFVFYTGLFAHSQRYSKATKNKRTSNEPLTVLYYVEKWDDEHTQKDTEGILNSLSKHSEVILLISAEYAHEAKFYLDKLQASYPTQFSYNPLTTKTRGMSSTQLALLTGVRKAKNTYITFFRDHQKAFSTRFVSVSQQTKKDIIFFGYSNIERRKNIGNALSRLLNFHTQMLSFSFLIRGLSFIAIPRNIYFPKKYFLRNSQNPSPSSTDISAIFQHFAHIGKQPFKAAIYLDADHKLQERLPISKASFVSYCTNVLRRCEKKLGVLLTLFLYALSNVALLVGGILLLLRGGLDLSHPASALTLSLLIGIGLRYLFYWLTLFFFWSKTEKTSIGFLLPLFDILFGGVAIIVGFAVWILKPFNK